MGERAEDSMRKRTKKTIRCYPTETCAWCGTVFQKTGPNHKYCSKEHAAAAAKARKGEAPSRKGPGRRIPDAQITMTVPAEHIGKVTEALVSAGVEDMMIGAAICNEG